MRKATVLLALTCVLVPAGARASGCDGPPAAFVAVSYDDAMRDDFVQDVDNFRSFANALKASYCLPESRVMIRAMNGLTRGGYTYAPGTEAGFKQDLAGVGALAAGTPDFTVFVMVSSHGLFYASASQSRCASGLPAVGSFAALMSGLGEDGSLHDCELGRTFNESFAPGTRMMVAVDCSFCGGFSDSITAASGTARDDAATVTSGIPAPGRVVITGCTITTECLGSDEGGVLYKHMARALSMDACDGYTVPGFPSVQGVNVPVVVAADGVCSASEWFFGAVASVYATRDPVEVQQQFRIKYGLSDLASDIAIL